MSMAEKVFEEIRTLPEFELREVLDFVGYLKAKHGIALSQPANELKGAAEEEADWAEFEKLAGTWSGKFNREECYDRKVFR